VIDRLKWMADVLGPTLALAMKERGPIDLKPLIAQQLQMGDEGHNRVLAGTLLFGSLLSPALVKSAPADKMGPVLDFLARNQHFFLNFAMAASKATLDAASNIDGCTITTVMCRNGVDFGVRLSGTHGAWFTAPSPVVNGLFFPGYSVKDANPDMGDSSITETAGIGGFAMAAAPAIVRFVGGKVADALNYTKQMYEITLTSNSDYSIPSLDFAGAPMAIDARRVVDSGVLPIINTGIAHRLPGVGQIGAGITRAPMPAFNSAIKALAQRLGVRSYHTVARVAPVRLRPALSVSSLMRTAVSTTTRVLRSL